MSRRDARSEPNKTLPGHGSQVPGPSGGGVADRVRAAPRRHLHAPGAGPGFSSVS